MAETYRVCTGRKYKDRSGNEKTAWTRIGAAWPRESGGMSVQLDALPMGRELVIFPPDDEKSKGRAQGGRAGQSPDESDDEAY